MVTFGKRMMMTLVGGLSLLFLAQGDLFSAKIAPVQDTSEFRTLIGAPDVGDSIVTGAYCVNVDLVFMKRFTAILTQYGTTGYWKLIEQRGFPCYDTRMKRHDVKPVRATLMKRLWEFELYKGKRYIMWKVKDSKGGYAYTWTESEGQET